MSAFAVRFASLPVSRITIPAGLRQDEKTRPWRSQCDATNAT